MEGKNGLRRAIDMSKIRDSIGIKKVICLKRSLAGGHGPLLLDKLAQLPTSATRRGKTGSCAAPQRGAQQLAPTNSPPTGRPTATKETLKKRARSKYYTALVVNELLKLDTPLWEYYARTRQCCSWVKQEGSKLTSSYCNSRVCHICNRIRTGKAINGYMGQVKDWVDQGNQIYFLTLTQGPTVPADRLGQTINGMIKTFAKINRVLRERRGIPINGIRKLECTYNPRENLYHPHFHVLMDRGADEFMAEWLKRYPNACPWSQDIRIADSNSLKELFKYSTKIIDTYKSENPEENPENKEVNIEIYPEALDNIMRALYGRRILQPFGNIKKVNDEVEELQSQEYLDIPYHIEAVWFWTGQDWYTDQHPEGLTGYTPPPILQFTPLFYPLRE